RDGEPGPAGRDGEPGLPGRDGERGERGPEGPQGKLPLAAPWLDGVHYQAAVVTHDGSTWQARRDTGQPPPHDDWLCLAAVGDAGRSLAVRGTYDASKTYSALDIVVLGGSAFVARRDDPGSCPGDGWQLIAKRGQ